MKRLILLIAIFLTACGPSLEEKRQVEMEQERIEQEKRQVELERQRIEKETSERLAQENANRIAAVTCSIMGETRNMDAAIRVREMNDAREKIGGEAFLNGDDAIQEAFEYGLCQELVLNENYYKTLQPLKDAKRERERIVREKRAEKQRIAAEKRTEEKRIAEEKQRIADSKPTVKEEFYSNGKLRERTNFQPKSEGGKKHGLSEIYYENGQLEDKLSYKDGKLHGPQNYYFQNGQLKNKSNFKDGKRNGVSESYYETGQLEGKSNFKEGEFDGPSESYYETGQLKYKSNFKEGEIDGLWINYLPNGRILGIGMCYKNGEVVKMSYCDK